VRLKFLKRTINLKFIRQFHDIIFLIIQYKYLQKNLQDLILRTRLCGTDFLPNIGFHEFFEGRSKSVKKE